MSKEDTCVLFFTEKDVRLSITYVLSKETKNTTNMFL